MPRNTVQSGAALLNSARDIMSTVEAKAEGERLNPE